MSNKTPQDYPGGFLSFPKPLQAVPTEAINDPPLYQVCVNEHWLEFILGAIKVLARPETWNDTYDNMVRAASEIAYLHGTISEGCQASAPSKLCVSGSFADLPYNVENQASADPESVWISGTGWIGGVPTGTTDEAMHVQIRFPDATTIRSYDFSFHIGVPVLVQTTQISWSLNGTIVRVDNDTHASLNDFDAQSTTPVFADEVFIDVVCSNAAGSAIQMTDISLCYTGIFPLSTSEEFFSHTFDFTVNDGGWTPRLSGEAVYSSGVGWVQNGAGTNDRCVIEKNVPAGVVITKLEVFLDWSFGTGDFSRAGHRIYTWVSGGYQTVGEYTVPGTGIDISIFQNALSDKVGVNFYACVDTCTGGSVTVKKAIVSGIGPDPF